MSVAVRTCFLQDGCVEHVGALEVSWFLHQTAPELRKFPVSASHREVTHQPLLLLSFSILSLSGVLYPHMGGMKRKKDGSSKGSSNKRFLKSLYTSVQSLRPMWHPRAGCSTLRGVGGRGKIASLVLLKYLSFLDDSVNCFTLVCISVWACFLLYFLLDE